jgi:transposase
MSKHRVAVLKVVTAQASVTAAAAECGISRQHLHRLLRRYREGGLDDLEQEVTVVALDTGEILSSHLIEPDRRYWRNQRRDPGRWPRSKETG